MRQAPISRYETTRLAAVEDYDFDESSPTAADLDQIAVLASNLFRTPIALVTKVERSRQIFLGKVGLETCETDRSVSFCGHAIYSTEVFVILDATLDARFVDNPLVTGPPQVRFYAGAPLTTRSGQAIGTLCIIDSKPRSAFSSADRSLLAEVASLAMDRLELNRLESARIAGKARFKAAADLAADGVICTDENGLITYWNATCQEMFGPTLGLAVGQNVRSLLSLPSQISGAPIGESDPWRGLMPGATIELSAIKADGSSFPVELSMTERVDDGVTMLGCIVRDLTGRRAREERLYQLAHFDALTGLPNRTVLTTRLDAVSRSAEPACILSIDLDGFKAVNDTLGHQVGDALLKAVGERLLSCSRPSDTVARMGGDEFVFLLPGISDPAQAATVADRVIAAIAEDFVLEGKSVSVSASVGFALHPASSEVTDDLISNADLALYQAKAEGRHCRRMFKPEMRERARLTQTQGYELRRAFERDEFEVFYQPQVRLSDGLLLGAEALLRWNHPRRGLMSPGSFLPNLEAGPMATPVGNWVLENACMQAAKWRAWSANFSISVNLFGAQFRTRSLSDTVRSALGASGLPPKALELEITENIVLRQDDQITEPLADLKELGVGIAFDDYGTGYASLSMLKTVPLTRLKLDQSFVRGMCDSKGDLAIVHAVLFLGQKFDLEVIAEGVETEAQRQLLIEEGCTTAQGYLFGRPMSANDFSAKYGMLAKEDSALSMTSRRAVRAV